MSKEFRIGLIALVSGALLYYGFNYLKGTDVFANTNRYYVEYPNTDGLTVGSAVKIKGVQVGKVSSVYFQSEKNNVLVEIDLQGTIELGDSTVAELASDGLLGGKAIILNRKTHRGLKSPGDYLIPKVDKGLNELLEQAQPITDNIQVTIRELNEILLGLEGFGDSLNVALGNVNALMTEVTSFMKRNGQSFDSIANSSAALIVDLREDLEPVGDLMTNLTEFTDSLNNSELNETIASTNELLGKVSMTLDTLVNNQGTIGKLVSDDSLYQNLNKALVDLDKLLIHFNQYPRDFMKPLGRKHDKLEGLKDN